MALVGEKNVRNILVMKAYPNHATMSEALGAPAGDGVCVSSDGTAPANGAEFVVGVKNSKGTISSFPIHPSRVVSASSVAGVSGTMKQYTIGIPASPTAGELYKVTAVIKGVGSFSAENEYLKHGFYKVISGDNGENVVDGLIKSLARNFSREEPKSMKTFVLTDAAAATHVLPENLFFDFDKNTSDGTASVVTLTMTAVATEDGNVKITLNGSDYYVPVTSGGTTTTLAAEITAWFDANSTDYTAVDTANAIAFTSKYERVEQDLAFDDNGVAGVTATVAQTTPGVDGTAWEVVITEKNEWLQHYYVTGKKTRLSMDFHIDADFGDDSGSVALSTPGTIARGSGYEVRNMEEYLLGNRQDTFRGAGYPHNFPEEYVSELDANYNMVEVEYKDYGRDDEQIASKQSVIIAVKEAEGVYTQANALIADLNTAINGANGVVIGTLA